MKSSGIHETSSVTNVLEPIDYGLWDSPSNSSQPVKSGYEKRTSEEHQSAKTVSNMARKRSSDYTLLYHAARKSLQARKQSNVYDYMKPTGTKGYEDLSYTKTKQNIPASPDEDYESTCEKYLNLSLPLVTRSAQRVSTRSTHSFGEKIKPNYSPFVRQQMTMKQSSGFQQLFQHRMGSELETISDIGEYASLSPQLDLTNTEYAQKTSAIEYPFYSRKQGKSFSGESSTHSDYSMQQSLSRRESLEAQHVNRNNNNNNFSYQTVAATTCVQSNLKQLIELCHKETNRFIVQTALNCLLTVIDLHPSSDLLAFAVVGLRRCWCGMKDRNMQKRIGVRLCEIASCKVKPLNVQIIVANALLMVKVTKLFSWFYSL